MPREIKRQSFGSKAVEEYFEILELLRNPDIEFVDTNLDKITILQAKSVKTNTDSLLKQIFDQPSFSTYDHQNFRRLLLDWYASHRTITNKIKNLTDVFALSNSELNEVLLCYGFPYPDRILNINNKRLLILDLINIYSKKGTPSAIHDILFYFGAHNYVLYEWWIKRYKGRFVAHSQGVMPVDKREYRRRRVNLEEITRKDPLWQLTIQEMEKLYFEGLLKERERLELNQKYSTEPVTDPKYLITLPSISPYFSLESTLDINKLNPILSIINKQIQEEYERWLITGELTDEIQINNYVYLEKYPSDISLLELVLIISYLFDGTFSSDGTHMYMYTKDLDTTGDGYTDVDFSSLLKEYEELKKRSVNMLREDRDQNYQKIFTTFISETIMNFQKGNPAEQLLKLINKDLYEFVNKIIDDKNSPENRDYVLESFLRIFDGYVANKFGYSSFSVSWLIMEGRIFQRIWPVINFMKPFRARMLDMMSVLDFRDPCENSALIKDPWKMRIIHTFPLYGEYGYDNTMTKDYIFLNIYQDLKEKLFCWLDELIKDSWYLYLEQTMKSKYPNILDNTNLNINMEIGEVPTYALDGTLVKEEFKETYLAQGFIESLFQWLDELIKDSWYLYLEQTMKSKYPNILDNTNLNINMELGEFPTYTLDGTHVKEKLKETYLAQGFKESLFQWLDELIRDSIGLLAARQLINDFVPKLYDRTKLTVDLKIGEVSGKRLDNSIYDDLLSNIYIDFLLEKEMFGKNLLGDAPFRDSFSKTQVVQNLPHRSDVSYIRDTFNLIEIPV